MYAFGILFLPTLLRPVLCSSSDFNLIWYEANKTQPHFYTAKEDDRLENAAKIVLNQKISVLRNFDLGFAGNLKSLMLDNCGLSYVEPESFRNPVPLVELSITGNDVKTIRHGVFNYLDVQHLNLSHNRIQSIVQTSFDHMKNLKSIILDHNELTLYDLWFQNCPNITVISARYNFIQYLPEDSFKFLKKRKLNVYFSYNKIQKIENNAFDINEFGECCLDHNELKELRVGLKKVYNLDLHENHLTCLLDDFLKNEVPKVTVLNLKANPVSCECLSKLQGYTNVLATPIEEGC